ncbi:MAG: LPS-assembly protein LptD [Gemmatimonadetes bacterium]|nr:LPS-assembly protein LptD [Gemmatimonadota bacterium]
MRVGGVTLAVFALAAAGASAQVPRVDTIRVRPDTLRARGDTARLRADRPAGDTSRAGRGAGLPQRPSRSFASPDSVVQSLLSRRGFRVTRYNADSVQFLAEEKEIRLSGRALVERDQSTLEADSVRYVETNCGLFAVGSPRLFDRTGVLVGTGMRYDACNHAGIIEHATTDFKEGSATWYLRGDLAVDNDENRIYAAGATITSCDLVDPHYHFAARQVKWVSKRLMVSRPAILYVADVPVLWLPFIFQDMRRGRRSGLMPPQFGLNDIVRNSPTYKRHVANLGYYWAMSDYSDAQLTLSWYAQRFIEVNGQVRYRWLDRFIRGGLNYRELHEARGSTNRDILWQHNQEFSLASSLNMSLHYASSASVISRNAVDPVLATAQIDSRLNYQRKFEWGQLNVGGSRSQLLDKPQVTMVLPTVSFTPVPIALSRSATWSPSFSLTNQLQSNLGPGSLVTLPTGDTSRILLDSRATSVQIGTPLRLGRWNWTNSISISDQWNNARETIRVPDPADTTLQLVRTYGESFETGIDWQTGINLPVLFQGSWNLQPSVQIVNTTGGAYLVRNRFTDGRFVSQGKRLQYSAGIAPTLFGLFGGVGPFARIRHSVSPSVSWSYSPAATVPEDYARALARGGRPATLRSDARQAITIGLRQNFEAKLRPPPQPERTDSVAAEGVAAAPAEQEGRKLRLLSIESSSFTFDLEQAKKPGRNAWVTRTFDNTFQSDLLRGFSLRTQHDLFDGPVGYTISRFDPQLTSVAAGFQLSSATFRALGALLGLRPPSPPEGRASPDSAAALADSADRFGRSLADQFQRGLATRYSAVDRLAPGAGRGSGFSASLSYSLQRTRVLRDTAGVLPTTPAPPPNQTVNGSLSFSPTPHWTVSWQTSYDFTRGEFNDHVVRLDRDLHDWRATFTFVKSANGNFVFSFFIQLIDQPDIKFDYDQRNIGGR